MRTSARCPPPPVLAGRREAETAFAERKRLDGRTLAYLPEVIFVGGYMASGELTAGHAYELRFLEDELAVYPRGSVTVLAEFPYAAVGAAEVAALGLLPLLPKLQRRLDRIAGLLEHGAITASMRVLADESDRRFVGALVERAVLAFLGTTLGIMSVMLIGTHGGPTFFPGTSLFHLLGYVGLFFSTVLVLRVVIAISREGI